MDLRCEQCGAINTLDVVQVERSARVRCTQCGAVLRRRRRQPVMTPTYGVTPPTARYLSLAPPREATLPDSPAVSEADLQRMNAALGEAPPPRPAPPPPGSAPRRVSQPNAVVSQRGRSGPQPRIETRPGPALAASPALRRAQEMARAALARPARSRPNTHEMTPAPTPEAQAPPGDRALPPPSSQTPLAPGTPPPTRDPQRLSGLPSKPTMKAAVISAPPQRALLTPPGSTAREAAPPPLHTAVVSAMATPDDARGPAPGAPADPTPPPSAKSVAERSSKIEISEEFFRELARAEERVIAREAAASSAAQPPEAAAPAAAAVEAAPAPVAAAAQAQPPAAGPLGPGFAPAAEEPPQRTTEAPVAAAQAPLKASLPKPPLPSTSLERKLLPPSASPLGQRAPLSKDSPGRRAAGQRTSLERKALAPPPAPPASSLEMPASAQDRPAPAPVAAPAPAPARQTLSPWEADSSLPPFDSLLLPPPIASAPPPTRSSPSAPPAPARAGMHLPAPPSRPAVAPEFPARPEPAARPDRPTQQLPQLSLPPPPATLAPAPSPGALDGRAGAATQPVTRRTPRLRTRSLLLWFGAGAAISALSGSLLLRGPGAAAQRAERSLRQGQALFESGELARFQEAHDLFFRALGANEADPRPLGALAELHRAWSDRLAGEAAEAQRHRQLARSYATQALAQQRNLPVEAQHRLQQLAAAEPSEAIAAAAQPIAADPPRPAPSADAPAPVYFGPPAPPPEEAPAAPANEDAPADPAPARAQAPTPAAAEAEPEAGARPRGYRAQLAEARRLLEGRRVRDAQRIYEQLLERRDDDPEVYAGLGACALRTEHYQAATEFYQRALELREGHPPSLLGLAETYRRRGDVARAIELYRSYRNGPASGGDQRMARVQIERLESLLEKER